MQRDRRDDDEDRGLLDCIVATNPGMINPVPPSSHELPEDVLLQKQRQDRSQIPNVIGDVVKEQLLLGAQSVRGMPSIDYGPAGRDPHGSLCFDRMLSRERQLCGEWAVFYHSYSYAALLYEVQAAVAAVLFRFRSEYGTLPRLLKAPYRSLEDAEHLKGLFKQCPLKDHDPRYRAVAISGTMSLLAPDKEAPPTHWFLSGYSCMDVSFTAVLQTLLVSCGVPAEQKKEMADKIVTLSGRHGLDVKQFGGKAAASDRAGHLLQIFMKRSIVNRYCYAALPYGVINQAVPNLTEYLESQGPIKGQVRLLTNPSVFMRGNAVRMYVYSADPSFHANRPAFQKELTDLLNPVIGTKDVRTKAAEGIYDGKLPAWFNPADFEHRAKVKASKIIQL